MAGSPALPHPYLTLPHNPRFRVFGNDTPCVTPRIEFSVATTVHRENIRYLESDVVSRSSFKGPIETIVRQRICHGDLAKTAGGAPYAPMLHPTAIVEVVKIHFPISADLIPV